MYFFNNSKAADISLSINGILMDLFAFLSVFYWIINPSVLYISTMGLFFGFRAICVYFLTKFPLP